MPLSGDHRLELISLLEARAQNPKTEPARRARVLMHLGILRKMQAKFHPEKTPIFYSALLRTVERAKQSYAFSEQWKGFIKNAAGVKRSEIDWVGVDQWLDRQQARVSKEALAAYVRKAQPQLMEVTKGDLSPDQVRPDAQAREQYSGVRGRIAAELIDTRSKIEATWRGERHQERAALQEMEKRLISEQEAVDEKALADTIARLGDKVSSSRPKWSEETFPGGTDYGEKLLTVASSQKDNRSYTESRMSALEASFACGEISEHDFCGRRETIQARLDGLAHLDDLMPWHRFHGPHWKETNVVVHIRHSDHMDAGGNRVLIIEEIQSDWHRQGRERGYYQPEFHRQFSVWNGCECFAERLTKDGAEAERARLNNIEPGQFFTVEKLDPDLGDFIPNGPFKRTWHELAMKRMLRYAAQHGYPRMAWTTGDQQTERYHLRPQVREILARRNSDGTYRLEEQTGDGVDTLGAAIPANTLAEYVGDSVAEKIISQKDDSKEYRYLDLEAGGEGMRTFYDRILPSFMNKYVKKWGAQVGKIEIFVDEFYNFFFGAWPEQILNIAREKGELVSVHSIEITPAMQESVMEGQPLFCRRQESLRALDAAGTLPKIGALMA